MTKTDIINEISKRTGTEKMTTQSIVESFMDTVRSSMINDKMSLYVAS